MNYLSAENLSKTYGIKQLFDKITFGINKGEKVGLIARNGTGKSTLLKILANKEYADEGNVIYRNDLSIGYLSQTEEFNPDHTISEVLDEDQHPALKAIKEYNRCLNNNLEGKEMEAAFEAMNVHNAWDVEVRLKQILSELKINDVSKKISTLSGGQKKRLSLARVLVYQPDFMILDEPTNHLDLDMIEWLETILTKSTSSLLMVTHDRYFLETICNSILELDQGALYKYTGNYSYYLEKKAEREELEKANITKAKNLMRKELEWMRRMPKARGTKSKARKDAFYELKQTATKKISKDKLQLDIKMDRLGSKIIEFHKVNKSFNDLKILETFSYNFQRQEKLGIVGKNGTGKSTFLNLLTGTERIDSGKIITGETIKIGYYKQDGIRLNEDKRVIEVVKDIAEIIPVEGGRKLTASQFLERFLFPTKMHFQYVSSLSGGEKRRLYLMTILMANPNFLILDEPTNDLDIFTMNVLEEYLENFKGCLIVVTHDRYFMDKVVDHLFVFQGSGKIHDILGNYTVWREKQKEEVEKGKSQTPKNKPTKKVTTEKNKLTYKEKIEFQELEAIIDQLENQKTKLTSDISSGKLDSQELMKASTELSQLVQKIEDKTNRWMELAEFSD